jgi:hypothetical protein
LVQPKYERAKITKNRKRVFVYRIIGTQTHLNLIVNTKNYLPASESPEVNSPLCLNCAQVAGVGTGFELNFGNGGKTYCVVALYFEVFEVVAAVVCYGLFGAQLLVVVVSKSGLACTPGI